jgi:hypothetical protein
MSQAVDGGYGELLQQQQLLEAHAPTGDPMLPENKRPLRGEEDEECRLGSLMSPALSKMYRTRQQKYLEERGGDMIKSTAEVIWVVGEDGGLGQKYVKALSAELDT